MRKHKPLTFPTDIPQPWCGIDEAGRGPWAGPVIAAAVIFDADRIPSGLRDSKRLSASQREKLAPIIQAQSIWAIGMASHAEIDAYNILRATELAMQRAVTGLSVSPKRALVDGNWVPKLPCQAQAIIGGDDLIAPIAAASILAKVTRDAIMLAADSQYPGYGFASHKGYGVESHRAALDQLGPCAIHRRSFRPVQIAAARQR